MLFLKFTFQPIQLQEPAKEEFIRILEEGHIDRVPEVTDKEIIRPVVITVKGDKSLKIAHDARGFNNESTKDQYQMPNLESI